MQNQNKWSFWENSRLRCFVANFIADGAYAFFVLFFWVKKCACANFYTFRMSVSGLGNLTSLGSLEEYPLYKPYIRRTRYLNVSAPKTSGILPIQVHLIAFVIPEMFSRHARNLELL